MKNTYLLLILSFAFYSCESEVEEGTQKNEIKFAFEALDQTNYNNAQTVLTQPNSNVRLDSIVYFRYYRFNPEINSSYGQAKDGGNQRVAYGAALLEDTNRRTEVYKYNNQQQLTHIFSYINFEYKTKDLTKLGKIEHINYFNYDNKANLIESGYQELDETGSMIKIYDYVYNQSNRLTEMTSSANSKFIISELDNQIKIEFFLNDEVDVTKTLGLDAFKNVTNMRLQYKMGQDITFEYKYPKNIFNPFVNLFPNNFYPFLNLSLDLGGYQHFSTGGQNPFYESIQVNNQGFPEVVQSGSYDDGYRTLYYYSNY